MTNDRLERAWTFLSDLHLGDEDGGRDIDRALPRFLGETMHRHTQGSTTLVLLGDTFDLHGSTRLDGARVLSRLRWLASVHGPVLAALADCTRAGVDLEVVGGNHDVELTRPEVAACFRTLLGLEPDDPRVRVSPWVLHERGVFYAEHGNQHYELNRLPTIAAIAEPDGMRHLPVTPLGACGAGSSWCPGEGTRTARVARALRAARRQEGLVTSPWYRSVLAGQTGPTGMDGALLLELAGVTRYTRRGAVVGALCRAAQRRLGREPAPVLPTRAQAIHEIMTRHGSSAAAYVFGHNHRAERHRFAGASTGGPEAVYLNAGTWCPQVRGEGPDTGHPDVFPFVTVVDGPTGVRTSLDFWEHDPAIDGHPDPSGLGPQRTAKLSRTGPRDAARV